MTLSLKKENMNQHPLSIAFPSMDVPDFENLRLDIKLHGQRQPIITFDGMVLDGWHRHRACTELGIEPQLQSLGEDVDPVAYVHSVNLHRRHLTGSQRAAAVVACAEWAKPGHQAKQTPGVHLATMEAMAKAADVHPNTIKAAKKAQEAGLSEAVRDGKVSAKQAAKIARLPEAERQGALNVSQVIKPKPEPKTGDKDSRIINLERLLDEEKKENSDLKDQFREQGESLRAAIEDNESLDRVIREDDRLTCLMNEVARYKELARVTECRNRGLIGELSEAKKCVKSWKRKFETLERKLKGLESTPEDPTAEDLESEYPVDAAEVG